MRATLNGQQIIYLLAKYGPAEFPILKEIEGQKTSITVKVNAKGNFYAHFETVEEETDD